jgi:hypothetical protein
MGFCDSCGNVARLIILGLTAAGICFQSWAAADCKFLTYTTSSSSNNGQPVSSGFGLFRVVAASESDSCVAYPDGIDKDDPMLYAAQIMIVAAACFAFCSGCLVAFEWLLCKIPCAGCLESLGYTAAKICSSLVYLAFGSDFCVGGGNFSCGFGPGASYNVAALACYFGASIVLCCSPKPDPICKQCR